MHPEVTPLVRQAIKRRYEMIPYLYSLMLVSHQEAVPPQRWTGWGYEADPEVWTNKTITDGETQYWLGDALLVGGVYEPGVSQASVYLPKAGDDDEGFININSPYEHFEAGRWATIDAQWHGAGIPVLAKVGSAIPIGRDAQVLSPGEKENVANLPLDDYRGVEIFPPPKGKGVDGRWYKTTWYEDDGVSTVRKNRVSSYTIAYRVQGSVVEVTFARDESFGFVAPWKSLTIILPVGDMRDLTIEGQDVELVGTDKAGRRSFRIAV